MTQAETMVKGEARPPGWSQTLGGCAAVRLAFQGELVALRLWRCLADGGGMATERAHATPVISLGFAGASVVRCGRERRIFDPVRGLLWAPDQPYAAHHPWGCGCRGCHLLLTGELARELERRRLPAGGGPWPLVVPPRLQLRCRRLVAALARRGGPEAPEALEPLAAEEELLALTAALLASRPETARPPHRAATQALHRRQVREACGFLEERYREPLTLAELARRVNASPAHLARLFRHQTGLPLHRYRTRLRLLEALDRVIESDVDLSTLAHELGFSSHSHLTAAFRAELGLPPGAVRRQLGRRALAARREALRASLSPRRDAPGRAPGY